MTEPLSDDDGVEPPIELDGRRKRRDRNRDAVVDAMLDLHLEGHLAPGVADIAERSGVSHRSVFRYFDDLDELFEVAIDRGRDRWSPLLRIHNYGEGSLDERIDAFVEQRITFHAASGPTHRAQRLKAPFSQVLHDQLNRTREFLRSQIDVQFARELAVRDQLERQLLVGAIDSLTSLEAHDLMALDQGRSPDQVALTFRFALERLLA